MKGGAGNQRWRAVGQVGGGVYKHGICGLDMADVWHLHRKERKWAHTHITGPVGPTSQGPEKDLSLKNESVNTWQHKSLRITVFGFPTLALNQKRLG